jgi:hypothetical protein
MKSSLHIWDGNNSLTLVKEAAMKYISENPNEVQVLASNFFSLLCESPLLMAEVMLTLANRVEVLTDSLKCIRVEYDETWEYMCRFDSAGLYIVVLRI